MYASDDCGNTSGTVSQTIMVEDHTAPTIGGQGSNGTVECPASPTFTAPTASDTCGGATVHDLGATTTAGTCGHTYTSTKSRNLRDLLYRRSDDVRVGRLRQHQRYGQSDHHGRGSHCTHDWRARQQRHR